MRTCRGRTEGRTDVTNIILAFLNFFEYTCKLAKLQATESRINNCPTRCNTKQSIYYSASSLYMFRVSTTLIIRITQNCNYSLRYWSYFLCSYLPPTWPSLVTLEGGSCTKYMTSTGGCSYNFVYCWWWVWLTPETCRVNLQNNK